MAQDAGLKIEGNIFSDANHLGLTTKIGTTSLLLKQQECLNIQKIVGVYQTDDVAKKMDDHQGQYFQCGIQINNPLWSVRVQWCSGVFRIGADSDCVV